MPLDVLVKTSPLPTLPRKRGRVRFLCRLPRLRGRGREGGSIARCATAMFGALALFTSSTYAADVYPNRPIRLVVGFGAGGPTDIPARYIADKLGAALGQPVVVEKKPAAGG